MFSEISDNVFNFQIMFSEIVTRNNVVVSPVSLSLKISLSLVF